jgi:diguanylate cyclase (GGDEF)-like protein/PAS domain S-box-containing protein
MQDLIPAAYRAIIEKISDGVIIMDSERRIVHLNPTAEDLLAPTASQMIGQPITQFLKEHPLSGDTEELEGRELTFPLKSAGQPKRERHYTLQTISITNGEQLLGRAIVLHDITPYKEAQALLAAEKQLFEILASIATATAATERRTLTIALQSALEMGAKLTGAEAGGLYLLEETEWPANPWLYSQVPAKHEPGLRNLISKHGLINWVIRHHQAALVSDTSTNYRWQPCPDLAIPICSALTVPLVSGPLLLGTLTLLHSQTGHFTPDHLQLIESAAGQMALAVYNAQVFGAQSEIAKRQTTLYEVLRAVAEKTAPAEVAQIAVETITRIAGWPNVSLILLDHQKPYRRIDAADPVEPLDHHDSIEKGIIGRAIRQGKLQLLSDATTDPDYTGATRSELVAPVQRGGQILGVLNLASNRPAAFDADDVRLAESLAEAVALALDNAQLHVAERARLQELEAVRRASLSLTSSLELSQVLNAILEAIVDLTAPQHVDIFLHAEGQLAFGAAMQIDKRPAAPRARARPNGLTYAVAQSGTAIVVPNVHQHPLFAEMPADWQIGAVAGLPLKIGQRVVGVMNLAWPEPDTIPSTKLNVLELLADQAAIAIENARLFQTIKQAEEALRQSEERYALAAQGANDGLWDWDLLTNEIYFSPRWKAMLGYNNDEIGYTPEEWFRLVPPENYERLKAEVMAHINGITPHFEYEHRMRHKDGAYRWMLSRGLAVRNAQGQAYRLVGSQTDVTERKQAEQLLLHDAFHNKLTNLPNRALFVDHLGRSLGHTMRQGDYLFAVLFLDLDRFKLINESLGHDASDQLLLEVSHRLKLCVRSGDTVAHMGGDEFAMLLDDIKSGNEATDIAHKIQLKLSEPVHLGGHEFFTAASIGITLSTMSYEQPEEILRDAEMAMYQAKQMGRGRYKIFDASLHVNLVNQMKLETDLRRAIEREELMLQYQPIVSLSSGQITGVEALLRWHHPEHGSIAPLKFIPLAEETGLIEPIGEWLLHTACAQAAAWHAAGYRSLRMSVNISIRQLHSGNLPQLVENALVETGLDVSALALEVTESVAMSSDDPHLSQLVKLNEMGVGISIDDFGTGYSSLSRIKALPVNTLKVDKSFVKNIVNDPNDRAIITAIIAMAHSLSLKVIAEGVETKEQLAFLKAQQCDEVQGHLFSRSALAEAVTRLLQEGL